MQIVESTYLGNTLRQWGLALLFFFLILTTLYLVRRYIFKRLVRLALRSQVDQDDLTARLPRQTKSLFLVILSIYVASLALTLSLATRQGLRTLMTIAILLQVGLWAVVLINFLVERQTRLQAEKDPQQPANFHLVGLLFKFALWVLVVLLILDNIPGVQVTSLVTGLGIGGIAVALAVQNILSDLFASLSITLDKPFVVGDNIRVGEMSGTVEHIGLKSTRVRSVDGEQLVFSNNDLLSSRIQNLKRMERRRIVFTIQVIYDTPYDKLEAIPRMIEEIVSGHDRVTFDRAHFSSYGEYALRFEVSYTLDSPDFQTYMDTQQSINLKLFKKFEDEGIEFAYPTQTIFLEK
jgi:small-conductance mechanosensitive channel